MAVIKFVCLFVLIPLISCRQINFLPFEKVKAYLNDDPTSDYEVVSLVHNLHKRSLPSTVRIRAFQEDIELYLEPNENYLFGENTPVFLAYRGLDKKNIFKPVFHDKMTLYHDVKNNAALVVEENEDKHVMYGIIGDYMIRPSTSEERLSERNKRSTGSENKLTARDNEIFADDHVLIKINHPKVDRTDGSKIFNRVVRSIATSQSSDDTKQDRIYPEILVTADYNYFLESGGDVNEFIRYQAVFWNGVDLLFRYFENPEIRLNVAGVVISQESSADIYPKKFIMGNKLSIDEFIDTFPYSRNVYLDDDFPKISYDLVVALTNYELADDLTAPANKVTFGIAFNKGACRHVAIAVVRDLLSFHAVPFAAHEIGHLLGAVHDMDPECTADVPVADYLMSYSSTSENQFRWSACSLKYMGDFLKTPQARCLRNKPTVISSPYTKFLPGKVANLVAQCESILPGSKPVLDDKLSVCRVLRCAKAKGTSNETTKAFHKGAAEGSACGVGGVCIQGDCIQSKLIEFLQTAANYLPFGTFYNVFKMGY